MIYAPLLSVLLTLFSASPRAALMHLARQAWLAASAALCALLWRLR